MTPRARQIIREVATCYGVSPELLVSKCRVHRLLPARIEIAKLLRARGYSTPQIGRIMNRDHTTIVFYLGNLEKVPAKPRWHRPRIKTIWKAKKPTRAELLADKLVPPREKRVLYLRPYAGAYMPEYQWKERA